VSVQGSLLSAAVVSLVLIPLAHTFRAPSIDAVGNVDPNPLVRSWRIT
jgi:hypothetical protein